MDETNGNFSSRTQRQTGLLSSILHYSMNINLLLKLCKSNLLFQFQIQLKVKFIITDLLHFNKRDQLKYTLLDYITQTECKYLSIFDSSLTTVKREVIVQIPVFVCQ